MKRIYIYLVYYIRMIRIHTAYWARLIQTDVRFAIKWSKTFLPSSKG